LIFPATVGCKIAMLHSRARPLPPSDEAGCQTEEPTLPQQTGDLTRYITLTCVVGFLYCHVSLFYSFSREQLEQELLCVVAERDNLVIQLREATLSFQQQLTELNDTCKSLPHY